MSKTLFNFVSLEEVDNSLNDENVPEIEELTDLDNYQDDVLALDSQLRGINAAFEDMNNLTKLKNIILKYKGRHLNKQSIKMVKIVTENIKTNLKVLDNSSILSLETISESDNVEVCVESITSILKAIYTAILNTFKNIWNFIVKLFTNNSKTNKENVHRADKVERELKTVMHEVRAEDLPNEMPVIDNPDVIAPFNYLNSELTDEKLIEMIKAFIAIEKNLNILITETEGIEVIISKFFENISQIPVKDLIRDHDEVSSVVVSTAENETQALNYFIEIDKNFEKLEVAYASFNNGLASSMPEINDSSITKIIHRALQGIKFDESSVRVLTGFKNGGLLCLYKQHDTNSKLMPLHYEVKMINDPGLDGKVIIRLPEFKNVELIAKLVKDLTLKAKDLDLITSTKFKAIESSQRSIVNKVEQLVLAAAYDENATAIQDSFKKIQAISTSLVKFSIEVSSASNAYTNTVRAYIKLIEQMLVAYKIIQ